MTNESIDAIIAGLDPKPEDVILSICAQGMVPLALAQYVKKVIAIDSDRYMIEEAKNRVNLIKNGQYTQLIDRILLSCNQEYFSSKERLKEIQEKADRIEFIEGNIFFQKPKNLPDKPNKAYLSNACSFEIARKSKERLQAIADIIPSTGLIYISDRLTVARFGGNEVTELSEDLGLRRKAEQANKHGWSPNIYRKI